MKVRGEPPTRGATAAPSHLSAPASASPLQSLMARITVVTATLMALATSVLLLQSNTRLRDAAERAELARIRSIAVTLAPHIDGDAHRAMARQFVDRDDIRDWRSAPEPLARMHELLNRTVAENDLRTPIYTLAVRESARSRVLAAPDVIVPDAMVYMVTSSETPYWRHGTAFRPAMMLPLGEGRVATVAPYDDDAGTWISAYAPIRDREGVVVGLLEVDASMDRILESIDQHTTQQVVFALLLFGVLLCAIIVLSARITASTTKLADAARAFGRGDYATPIAATGPPEVRELAHALEGARQKIARHVATQARSEAQLAATLARAEAATRVKSQFLANMSHELRTPMNAIMGYSEMLIEDVEEAGHADLVPDLKKIRSAGQHLLALINDILDLSKIEAGKMDLLLEDFSLPETLEEVLDTVRPLLAKNHDRLEVALDPELGVVHADVIRVRQILVNLLGNAAKFTEHGLVRVRAWLATEEDGGRSVFVEVTDTGIGMTPEQRARLFTAFSQADASTTRKYGGTGLGLALCKEFAQMMQGDIGCTSELGVGSTFTLRLPQRVGQGAARASVEGHVAADLADAGPAPAPGRAEPGRVC